MESPFYDFCKETHYENGKRVTTRLLAKVINGKQHIYLRSETEH